MLTSKQRAYLRGKASVMDTIFQIGKGGINDNMIKQLYDALEARELIKIRTLLILTCMTSFWLFAYKNL